MQTLGVSESTPASESRLKALFWPSVQSGADVDYLGVQGYWVCSIVATISILFLIVAGSPVTGILTGLFFYLGGVGVRERSRYAAIIVFAYYMIDTLLLMQLGVVRIILIALLLSNVRATWIAASWIPGSEEAALPPRMNETFGDKFADRFPQWLWPKIRILYYAYSGIFLALTLIGLAMMRAKVPIE
jgi:hypothetical protein